MRLLLLILLCAIAAGLFVTMLFENGYGHAWAIAYSPDGRQLVVSYNNEIARVWDMLQEQPEPLRMKLASDRTHWVFPSSPQFGGSRLLVAFRANRERGMPDAYELWDTAANCRLTIVELPYAADVFQVSAEGELVLASSKEAPRALDLFSLESGEHIGSLEESESIPGQLRNQSVMSANGQYVAASFDARDGGNVLKVWSTKSQECIKALPVRSGYGLVISHDGKFLADNGQHIWGLEAGEQIVSIDRGPYAHSGAALAADGRMLALSDFYAGKVTVWDATDGRQLAVLKGADSPMDASRRTYVAFSPDGTSMATATGRTVRLWELPGFRLKETLAQGYRLVAAVAFSTAFIIWSVVFGVLSRRWTPPTPKATIGSPRLVLPAAVLLRFTGMIAVANSTLSVLHPGLCSCCTPTLLLLIVAYAGLGIGILVMIHAISRDVRGLVPMTLMLMFFNLLSDFSFLSWTILLSGGAAILLIGIIRLTSYRPFLHRID